MAQVHEAAGAAQNTRRAPNTHSAELQEAKRREKMQAHSSSHRTAGATRHAEGDARDATH